MDNWKNIPKCITETFKSVSNDINATKNELEKLSIEVYNDKIRNNFESQISQMSNSLNGDIDRMKIKQDELENFARDQNFRIKALTTKMDLHQDPVLMK